MHAEGIIPEANYSDMLRTCLLLQYGGYWLDATCLLTSSFPEVIDKSEYFMCNHCICSGSVVFFVDTF